MLNLLKRYGIELDRYKIQRVGQLNAQIDIHVVERLQTGRNDHGRNTRAVSACGSQSS